MKSTSQRYFSRNLSSPAHPSRLQFTPPVTNPQTNPYVIRPPGGSPPANPTPNLSRRHPSFAKKYQGTPCPDRLCAWHGQRLGALYFPCLSGQRGVADGPVRAFWRRYALVCVHSGDDRRFATHHARKTPPPKGAVIRRGPAIETASATCSVFKTPLGLFPPDTL